MGLMLIYLQYIKVYCRLKRTILKFYLINTASCKISQFVTIRSTCRNELVNVQSQTEIF